MAGNDDRVDNPDEQYQFSDELNTTKQFELEGEEAPPKPSPIQMVIEFLARNRPLAFLLFITIAVSIVYQFVRSPATPTSQPTLQHPHAAATTNAFSAQQSAQVKDQITALQKKMSDNADAFRRVSQSNQSEVMVLKGELSQSKQTMAQLSANNAQLQTAMNKLGQQLAGIYQTLHPQAKVEPLRYYIQAVVPGRAWLSSNKGDYLTVQLGTNLPKYGAIRQINADAGLIATSSGKMIHFSANE